MAGITFGDMYFVHPTHSSEGIHFHELVHVVQWSTLGVNEFLLTYALGIAQHGYEQSPLEAIAFDLQGRFEQHAALDGVVDRVARHAVATRDVASAVFRLHGLKIVQPGTSVTELTGNMGNTQLSFYQRFSFINPSQ